MHHFEEQAKHTGVFLAYFFCDEKDFYRRIIRDVLKLLIRQMMSKNRDLTQHLLVDAGMRTRRSRQTTAHLSQLQRMDTLKSSKDCLRMVLKVHHRYRLLRLLRRTGETHQKAFHNAATYGHDDILELRHERRNAEHGALRRFRSRKENHG